MYKSIAVVFMLSLATTLAYSDAPEVELAVDEYGREYYLIPADTTLVRTRRDNSETKTVHGSEGSYIEHKTTLINNANHQLDAKIWAEKNFNKDTPLTTGQKFDYTHKPSDSVFALKAENTRGQGTHGQAEATYNFFKTQDKKGTIGIGGQYDRIYGAPWGTSRPNYGVFVRGTLTLTP